MNCLPIVSRELRVAARKRSTVWLRVAAALTGLVLGSGCLLLGSLQRTRGVEMGSILFHLLTWTCLVAGLAAGLFFTSDCLSEEKREGTLGLLFLTELRGYDVALGKLMATSLRGFYALLAVFPIVAITQLMGGITGAQYWKSSLALVNALFLSLAAGMFISAISRDSQKTLTATFFLVLLLALGGPVADASIAAVHTRGFQPFWSLSSPGYVLLAASAWGRSQYWSALLANQLLAWALFALACALVPRTWQERKSANSSGGQGWAYAWKYGGVRHRARLRRKLLERLPMAWLTCRERWQSLGLWTMALLTAGGFVAVLMSKMPREAWIAWIYIGGLFKLILYVLAASQACRFFVEARRSGLLELLLVTPLNERQILRGQWQAWGRMFGLPVLLLLSVHVACSTFSQLSFQRLTTQAGAAVAQANTNQSGVVTNQTVAVNTTTVTVSVNSGTNAPTAQSSFQTAHTGQQTVTAVVAATAAALSTIANLLALGWFGMWMGLTSKTANLATLKTLLFVQVIPGLVIAFGINMVLGLLMAGLFFRAAATQSPTWMAWWPLLNGVLGACVAIGKDIGFIAWSRKRLHSSLRDQAARSPGQPRFVAPPPLPTAAPTPPVIPALR